MHLFVSFKGEQERRIWNSGYSGNSVIAPFVQQLLFNTQPIPMSSDPFPPFLVQAPTSNTQDFHAPFPSLKSVFNVYSYPSQNYWALK